jgi:hypothetical protein
MIELWDNNKIGTLIIGFYRNGTHFLQDTIANCCSFDVLCRDEICHDNTISELEKLTLTQGRYQICILNACNPKFYLTNRHNILKKWHVVNLTRNNKISHFISYWFWLQNSPSERLNNNGKFKHNNTSNDVYKQSLTHPVYADPALTVIPWLQEQLINRYIKSDVVIDYSDLPALSTVDVQWTPNQYTGIELENILTNAKEVKELLLNFDLSSKI